MLASHSTLQPTWLKRNSEDSEDDVDDNEEDIMTTASICSDKQQLTPRLPYGDATARKKRRRRWPRWWQWRRTAETNGLTNHAADERTEDARQEDRE